MFKDKEEATQAHHFIVTLWTKKPNSKRNSFTNLITRTASRDLSTIRDKIPSLESSLDMSQTEDPPNELEEIFNILNKKDWELLLQGAKTQSYNADQIIVSQSEQYQRIYQINKGTCRIEVEKDGQRRKLGVMKENETFGEISFLTGSGASAYVIADENVQLTIVEGYYINAL